jgi:type III secretion system chaperone SycN
MDWIASTVDAFGQALGIQGLSLDGDGLLALQLEDGAELAIQDLRSAGAPELLVALTKVCSRDPVSALRAALRASDFRHSPHWTLQVGLDDQDLVVGVRLPIGSVMLSSLEDAVDHVLHVHREADHGH